MEAAPKRAKAASKKTAEVQKERVLSDFGAKKKNGKVGTVCEAAQRLGARARLIVTIHRHLIIIKTIHISYSPVCFHSCSFSSCICSCSFFSFSFFVFFALQVIRQRFAVGGLDQDLVGEWASGGGGLSKKQTKVMDRKVCDLLPRLYMVS